MEINDWYIIFLGILSIVFGTFIIFKKQMIISGKICIVVYALFILFSTVELKENFMVMIWTYLLFYIMWIPRMKGDYTIYNVEKIKVIELIENIFKKRNMPYKIDEEGIILTEEYKETKPYLGAKESVKIYNKRIDFNNDEKNRAVSLNIKDIQKTDLHYEIIAEIKKNLSILKSKKRGKEGIVYIVLGIYFIAIVLWEKYYLL
ncbi:hypothetical protein [Inediibacterium massiliense]|uniref:hypothetical protein n=1 Tax=Inediibacterium massiliense TaxID=1658111 RepID=UPI0006B4BF75|nr:hypothetical protein [Inediibacterium massiliense]